MIIVYCYYSIQEQNMFTLIVELKHVSLGWPSYTACCWGYQGRELFQVVPESLQLEIVW